MLNEFPFNRFLSTVSSRRRTSPTASWTAIGSSPTPTIARSCRSSLKERPAARPGRSPGCRPARSSARRRTSNRDAGGRRARGQTARPASWHGRQLRGWPQGHHARRAITTAIDKSKKTEIVVPGRDDDPAITGRLSGTSAWPSTRTEGKDLRHGPSKSWFANGRPQFDGLLPIRPEVRHVHVSGTRTARWRRPASTKNDRPIGIWVWWHRERPEVGHRQVPRRLAHRRMALVERGRQADQAARVRWQRIDLVAGRRPVRHRCPPDEAVSEVR